MAGVAKGKVYPVYNNVSRFGTVGLESTDEQMAMPVDLENFAPSIDGTVEEWYSMDAAGWAKVATTDKKLGFSLEGRRSVGDSGNDYIVGLAWKFGQDVMTKFGWAVVSGTKLACNVVVSVTAPGGDGMADIGGLEFEVMGYGKPTPAPA